MGLLGPLSLLYGFLGPCGYPPRQLRIGQTTPDNISEHGLESAGVCVFLFAKVEPEDLLCNISIQVCGIY